jgi:hypothetical protein
MRFVLAILALLSVAVSSSAQDLSAAQVVQRIMDNGGLDGHYNKIIGEMGDAAAVIVTKIVAGRNVGSTDIDNALLVLDLAFADPSLVTSSSDREPRTALFVLKSLDSSTTDTQLKQRIAETRNRVTANFAKYKRSGATQ